ncbi:hypothetical protein J4218_04070 [Candidatus Pacearchaeota archaeon]|nr:hypothetical protein [Candidatus Pacearchaeota archaeon]
MELINDLFGTSVRFKDGATTFIKDTSELGYIYDFGSVVKQDRIFLKEASKFGHQTSERMEAMIERLLGGGDPGKGSHTLTGVSNSVLEATSQGKERIYYRIKHIEGQRSQLIILAYSLKDSSQKRVIDHLQVLYPPGYKFP